VIPDEYIVTFADDEKDAPGLAKRLVTEHGGTLRFTYSVAVKGFAARLKAQAVEALQRNPQIAAIERDRRAASSDVQAAPPNWVLDRIDQRTRPRDNAYVYPNTGAGVNVYILDSGIRTTHAEFGGRASGAYTAVSDGRGTDDCTGHGTHVAGVVGSARFGVAKGARLLAVRVMDCTGTGSYSQIIAGLDWVTANRVLPAVANMSLGGSASASLNDAVRRAVAAGVTVVVSAGNKSLDACGQSPAAEPAAITVGASDDVDQQSNYSNFGSCLDLYAPANNVRSSWYTSDTASFLASGTSTASPHVAGAAALFLASNPSATPGQVARALTDSATAGILVGLGTGSPNRLLYTGFIKGALSSPPPPELVSPPQATAPPPGPTVTFTVSCAGGRATCTFDASGSTAPAGGAIYTWSFGNGSTRTVTGAVTTYTYPAPGTYSVGLTITDGLGRIAVASQSLRVRRL
jgi:subtilisin family serine protease